MPDATADAWHALGRAYEGHGRWQLETPANIGIRVGMGPFTRAARAHLRALELDPAHAGAAAALVRLATRIREPELVDSSLAALRRGGARLAPEARLARGRLEAEFGDPDSALADFGAVARHAGSARVGLVSVAELERARVLLRLDREPGESLYYAVAARDEPGVVAALRDDLVMVASDSVLAAFDSARGPARAALLRRFWRDRDILELREPGERLREHYRRLAYARAQFHLTSTRRHYGPGDAYRWPDADVDDRGVIWVRHGPPTERLRPFVFRLMPNESWRYALSDGDLIFHFSAGGDAAGGGDLYDYRLVESVLDLNGAGEAPRDRLLLSRETLSPMYARMLNWGPYGAARVQDEERRIGRESIERGTSTDTHELRFAGALDAVADVLAVGGPPDAPVAQIVVGIPAGVLPAGGDAAPTVRVRASALDPASGAARLVDTTVTLALPRDGDDVGLAVGRAVLPLAGARQTVRVAVSRGDTGVVLPRRSAEVARPGPGPALSDLVLGTPRHPLVWLPAPGEPVHLAPAAVFRRDDPVELYYEVYGLIPDREYRHEIVVARPRRRGEDLPGRPLVALGFTERAGDVAAHSRRILGLERVRRGDYVLEVRVTDEEGRTAVRRRRLTVQD